MFRPSPSTVVESIWMYPKSLGSLFSPAMAVVAGVLSRWRGGTAVFLVPSPVSRSKTTSAQHVAARPKDPTFEKLMDGYKHLLKVIAVQDLILASPDLSLPLPLLTAAAQRLHLNRGAAHFVRRYPHIFSLHYDRSAFQPLVRLTSAAAEISRRESAAAADSLSVAVDRLERLLSISLSGSLPVRAVFKVWRELGLPDDFEDSVVARNPTIFSLQNNPREPNTHLLELAARNPDPNFTPAVEKWRMSEGSKADEKEITYGFKQSFPPGMRLSKNYRARMKEWQQLHYIGPYDAATAGGGARKSRVEMGGLEKRAVGIVHEFLSLTVEKMVEVEKISHFRKWFGIELNIRDVFIDHPGIFYLSTKGKRHTVFLREAYERGRLINPNPIYEARMRLLELVLLRQRGVVRPEMVEGESIGTEEEEEEDSCY